MKFIRPVTLKRVSLIAGLSIAWAQAPKANTARELFYTPPPAAKPAAAAKSANKTAAKKSPPAPVQSASAKPPAAVETPAPVRVEDGTLKNASVAPALPLGMRFSVLKYTTDTEFVEVDPDLVFRSGDKIKFRIQVNDPGFLYIVQKGSSGNWRVMFPTEEYDDGYNRVAPGRPIDIPGKTRLVFDEIPGTEKIFVALSRKPIQDMDRLMYDLESGKATTRPVQQEQPKPQHAPLKTKVDTVNDSVVQGVRAGVQARDLVFERINEEKPGAKSDKAVYAVDKSGSDESRVVLDFDLRHR